MKELVSIRILFVLGMSGAIAIGLSGCDSAGSKAERAKIEALYQGFKEELSSSNFNAAYLRMEPHYRADHSIDQFERAHNSFFSTRLPMIPIRATVAVRFNGSGGYVRIKDKEGGVLDLYAVRLYITNLNSQWYFTGRVVQEMN